MTITEVAPMHRVTTPDGVVWHANFRDARDHVVIVLCQRTEKVSNEEWFPAVQTVASWTESDQPLSRSLTVAGETYAIHNPDEAAALSAGGTVSADGRTFIEGPLLASIGNVVVIEGEPLDGNPYKGPSLEGQRRVEMLREFRDGNSTGAATFWFAPAEGGGRKITSPTEVDWRGLS